MKVVYLEPADFIGGAELFTADIISCLPTDIELILLSGKKSENRSALFFGRGEKRTFDFPRLRPFRFIKFVKTVRRLRMLVQSEKADLVHSNSVRTGLLGAFSGIPFTHYAHDFTTPRLLAPALNRARAILCCSEAVRSDLISKGVLKSKITVIPNGIRIGSHALNQRTQGLAPKIAIVGRIDSWKGQDIFINAASILHSRFPDAKFLIFGEPNSHDLKTVEFAEKLKAQVKAGKMDFVTFRGHVPTAEIYAEIDLLVQASTKPEPFGRTILEALAYGIPLVVANAGGAKEIMTGRLSGFLVPPGSAEAIAEKLTELIGSSGLRSEFVIAAKQRIKDYDLDTIAARFFTVWRQAVKTPRSEED